MSLTPGTDGTPERGTGAAAASAGGNPLLSDSPHAWDRLIESVGPASILVVINGRLGPALRAKLSAEDVFQETLLAAWRDRATFEWKGLPSFRRWLLSIAENRIRDLADQEGRLKRGGGTVHLQLSIPGNGAGSTGHASEWAGPAATTTPSRTALEREKAELMEDVLSSLPDDVREIVRLRLFEDLLLEEVGARVGLSEEAVRYRFRKGALLYHARLQARLDGGRRPGPGGFRAGGDGCLS